VGTGTQIEVLPMAGCIGAEIRGVDLRAPLSAAAVRAIRQALLTWKVVFFRSQELSQEEHIAFSASFGEIARRATRADPKGRHPPRTHGPTAAHQGGAGRLRPQKGDRRTRLRPDEGPSTSRASSTAWACRRHRRVDAARDLPQPAQA